MKRPDLSRATQDHWSRIYDDRSVWLFVNVNVHMQVPNCQTELLFSFNSIKVRLKSPKTVQI